ncbi:MAG: hypothetical protein ACJAXA_003091 [Candidatus Aldehydirespiratoraceae bacterium]|jgi:hypothetical protein
MFDRRTTPHPPGDDDPTPPRGNPVTRRAGDDDWEDWEEPNYLIRRSLVIGSVVLGIALVAIVIGQLIGRGNDSGTSSSANAEWDTIVVLTADEIQLLERESGSEIDRFDSADDLLDAQSVMAGNVLITMTDQGRIGQLDITDGSVRRGRSGLDETLRISAGNPRVAIAGPDSGGDITIIDTTERNVLSIADVAGLDDPLIFSTDVLVNPAGTHVAAPVPSAFQSVVINLAEQTSDALAGRVIALSDTLLVTEQPAGGQSEIEFHDLLGERLTSIDVPAPQASMLTANGTLVLVAADGSIRTATSDGSLDDVGSVTDAEGIILEVTDGASTFDHTRLVVFAGENVVVLDENGAQLGVATGSVSTLPAEAARCLLVSEGRSTQPLTVIDLTTGATITTIDRGLPASTSYDGCTAAMFGGPSPQLLTEGVVVDVDASSIATIAPDGDAYVVIDGRDTEFVKIGNEDEPREIADEPSVIHFGNRS